MCSAGVGQYDNTRNAVVEMCLPVEIWFAKPFAPQELSRLVLIYVFWTGDAAVQGWSLV